MDRRLIRGDRTRTVIIEAMIELIEAGNAYPTAHQVAERASVSVRSLYHHFGDLDGIFLRAARLHASRYRSLIVAIPPHGPVEEAPCPCPCPRPRRLPCFPTYERLTLRVEFRECRHGLTQF